MQRQGSCKLFLWDDELAGDGPRDGGLRDGGLTSGVAGGGPSGCDCLTLLMDLRSTKILNLKMKLQCERRNVKYLIVALMGSWALFLAYASTRCGCSE